jgi:hypothetical protein
VTDLCQRSNGFMCTKCDSFLDKRLLTSQEGLYCTELVISLAYVIPVLQYMDGGR